METPVNDFISHDISPVSKQMFIWFVNREDGSTAYEFTNDGENHDYNKEVDSRKDEIKEFGCLVMDLKFTLIQKMVSSM